jgi:hypothetical protein
MSFTKKNTESKTKLCTEDVKFDSCALAAGRTRLLPVAK